jgi:hypothetical protein
MTVGFTNESSQGKIQFTPLKFWGFFNLNPKVSKLAVYPPEVSKIDNLNLMLKFSVKMNGNEKKNSLRAISSFHSFLSNLTEKVDGRFKLPLFETSGG